MLILLSNDLANVAVTQPLLLCSFRRRGLSKQPMETSTENDSESGKPPDGKCHHPDAPVVVSTNANDEYETLWRRQLVNKSIEDRKKYKRSQSVSMCHIDKYTAGELRRIRERLLRTQRAPVPESGSIRDFDRTQKLTLASLALVDFVSFCSMSIMAPFFPKEAALKGMSQTVAGLVFSFYALVMFLSSPVFGKILPRVGAKFLFMAGMFVAGGCNLLFGLLAYIDDYYTFTAYCFVVRGMEALGASAYATASYVFVVDIFPDNIGSVLGILETFVGLGMSTGPAIGGLLYAAGGFALPFYCLGVLMVLIVPVNLCLLPSGDARAASKKSGSLKQLVSIPSVLMISLVIVVVSNTWGFLDPTLEPHLREFDLSSERVGLIFLMFSGVYGISSPVWGWLADKTDNHWSMMVWGLFVSTGGLLLLGPSPLLPFLDNSIWLNLVALSILGVSVALTLLPTFQGILDSAVDGGCTDGISTYSMVAGVWSCMYSLGEVIGPSLGGVLLQHYGFPICSTVMASFTFVLGVASLVFFSTRASCGADKGCGGAGDGGGGGVEREQSPLLAGRPSLDLPATRDNNVQYYERLTSHDSTEDDRSSGESRTAVAITAGGACEV